MWKAKPKKLFLSNVSSSLLLHTLWGTKRGLVRLRLFREHIVFLLRFLSSESLNAQRFHQRKLRSARSSSSLSFFFTSHLLRLLRLVDPLHENMIKLLISFVFVFWAFFGYASGSRHAKGGELEDNEDCCLKFYYLDC